MQLTTLLPFLPLSLAAHSLGFATDGSFSVSAGINPFCSLDNGMNMYFQEDANIVVRDVAGKLVWASYTTVANCGGNCKLHFQGDGNLVSYVGTVARFRSNTGGKGTLLICTDQAPYLAVLDAGLKTIWSTGLK